MKNNATITPHEKILLVVYRCLSDEDRATVDRTISRAWTEGNKGQDYTVSNARFGEAVRAIGAGRVSGDVVAYFANVGRKVPAVAEVAR